MKNTNLPFSLLAKPSGSMCNLDCKYCFYLEKNDLYPSERKPFMDVDVLERYIQSYIESQPSRHVSFVWQGGEPTLLGIDYYRHALELQKKHSGGKHIVNSIQTNGVLLDNEWCAFFKEAGFLVGISIDGPEALHDAYRVNKKGKASFKEVIRGIELLKKHEVEFNTLTVLHKDNANDPLAIYDFLKGLGSRYHQYIPLVECATDPHAVLNAPLICPSDSLKARPTPLSLTSSQYGHFLVTVFDEWVRRDVGEVYVQMFDSSLSSWMGLGAELCIFQKTCGQGLVIEHNGDVYACDHYVYPEYKVGSVMDNELAFIANGAKQREFGQNKEAKLTDQCRKCPVLSACNGGCPKQRIATSVDGEPGQNHFCSAYLKYFTHIQPFLNFMATELENDRPPSNVMAWSQQMDREGIQI